MLALEFRQFSEIRTLHLALSTDIVSYFRGDGPLTRTRTVMPRRFATSRASRSTRRRTKRSGSSLVAEIQLDDLFAGQHQCGAEFGVRMFQISHTAVVVAWPKTLNYLAATSGTLTESLFLPSGTIARWCQPLASDPSRMDRGRTLHLPNRLHGTNLP
jgi:hypothetical protein